MLRSASIAPNLQNLLAHWEMDTYEPHQYDFSQLQLQNLSEDPDELPIDGWVGSMGLDFKEHTVITDDGYILKVFRIGNNEGAPVVFFQHGLFSSAETWLVGKELSPAYLAAQAGYDVWLGNNRGTYYSRNHESLDPDKDDKKFFDYSFVELAKYDDPAMIDFVLSKTGKSSLSYVGHSQGTSQMFTALSYNWGNLNDKVNLFVATAPVTKLENCLEPHLVHLGSLGQKAFQGFMWNMNINELLGGKKWDSVQKLACMMFSCDDIEAMANDKDAHGINSLEIQETDVKRVKSTSSSRQLIHYTQLLNSGNQFKQYDWDNVEMNTDHYGSNEVPVIDLSQITTNVALFVGKQDDLGNPTDAEWIKQQIGDKVVHYDLLDDFDHFSFQVGKDMSAYIQSMLDLIAFYNP